MSRLIVPWAVSVTTGVMLPVLMKIRLMVVHRPAVTVHTAFRCPPGLVYHDLVHSNVFFVEIIDRFVRLWSGLMWMRAFLSVAFLAIGPYA